MKFRDDWEEVEFSKLFNFEVRLLMPLILDRLGVQIFRHKFTGTIDLISEEQFVAGNNAKDSWRNEDSGAGSI